MSCISISVYLFFVLFYCFWSCFTVLLHLIKMFCAISLWLCSILDHLLPLCLSTMPLHSIRLPFSCCCDEQCYCESIWFRVILHHVKFHLLLSVWLAIAVSPHDTCGKCLTNYCLCHPKLCDELEGRSALTLIELFHVLTWCGEARGCGLCLPQPEFRCFGAPAKANGGQFVGLWQDVSGQCHQRRGCPGPWVFCLCQMHLPWMHHTLGLRCWMGVMPFEETWYWCHRVRAFFCSIALEKQLLLDHANFLPAGCQWKRWTVTA